MKNSVDVNIEKNFYGPCALKIQKTGPEDGMSQQGITVTLSSLGNADVSSEDFFEATISTADEQAEFETSDQWLADDLLTGDFILVTSIRVMVERKGRDLSLAVGYREGGHNSQFTMLTFSAENCRDNGNIYISKPAGRNVWEIETL
jgi:hypothetical protein